MSESLKIEQTKDYSKFKVYNFNRPINKGLVQRLKASIQTIGFIQGKPILVDKDFTIKDGQHRFHALMELGMPIYYYVVSGDAHQIVTHLNAEQVNWKLADYVHSWAEEGVSCYEKLRTFYNTSGLNMGQAIQVFFKESGVDADIKKVKAGTHYSLNPKAQETMDFINHCKSVPLPYWKSSYFVRAVVRLFKVATPEQIEKIKKHIISLPQQASTDNYMIAFENMVNKGIAANKRITLRSKV